MTYQSYSTHHHSSENARIKITTNNGRHGWTLYFNNMRDVETYAVINSHAAKIIGKVLQIKTIEPHQPARYYVLASAYDGDTSIDSGPYTKKSEAIFQANLISVTEAEALADGYSFMDFPDIVLSTKVVSHTECKQLDSKALSHYLVIRRANELAANLQNW